MVCFGVAAVPDTGTGLANVCLDKAAVDALDVLRLPVAVEAAGAARLTPDTCGAGALAVAVDLGAPA